MDNPPNQHRWRGMDIVLVLLLVAAVIGIRASGPCTTYANAQLWQIGVTMDMANNGHWIWAHDQKGAAPRKPQLYAWLGAPVLMATGVYDDFTFRVPTMLAAMGTGLLVYLLGVRWYGRRAGLLAAAMWATTMGVPKLTYQATTDMLLAFWITASIFCVDRLVFRPARRRWPWAVGFWVSMTLAAWSKGWGVVNVPIVGLFVVLAVFCQQGFKGLWLAVKRIGLVVGLPAMLLVLTGLVYMTWQAGGEEFEAVFRFEVIQRFFGGGGDTQSLIGSGAEDPGGAGAPAALHLLYYGLPASILVLAAMVLARPRRWFKRSGRMVVPLCWIIAVVLPFSLSKGFRPDYLLPCHAALALMAAWAVEQAARRGGDGGGEINRLRHLIAGVPVVVGAGLIVSGAMMLPGHVFGDRPLSIIRAIELSPYRLSPFGRWGLAALVPLGAIVLVCGVRASLRRRVRTVAALGCVGMLGVALLNTHVISRHARTGDGQKMRSFAVEARDIINDDAFVMYYSEKLMFELYQGRAGTHLPWRGPTVTRLNGRDEPWLVTSGRGLVAMGAAENRNVPAYDGALARDYDLFPERLGEVVLSADAINEHDWGKIYLIRLARPIPPMTPARP